jgi:hypothetical protein
MEKELSFTGINLTPYNDIAPDGQCSVLHNMELHNGSLRPALLAGHEYVLPSASYQLAYVHATTTYRHFIFVKVTGSVSSGQPVTSYDVLWADEDETQAITNPTSLTTVGTLRKVSAVGNTLVLLTDEGLRYYLWSEGRYKYIGDKLPELGIQFSLEKKYNFDVTEDSDYDYHASTNDPITAYQGSNDHKLYDDSDLSQNVTVSDFIWACVNKLTSNFDDACLFYAPFFVRFAYRLYDGTVTKASHPVLMMPCTGAPAFWLAFTVDNQSRDYNRLTLRYAGMKYFFLLDMMVSSLGNLENWKDIVSSVDIYITTQNPKWKYGSQIKRLNRTLSGYGIFALNPYYEEHEKHTDFIEGNVPKSYFLEHAYTSSDTDMYIDFQEKGDEEYMQDLSQNAQFYKVAEYKIDELVALEGTDHFTNVKFSLSTLANLTQQDLLDDSYDYHSHDTLIPRQAMVYNSRLNLYDIERKPFGGFPHNVMHQYLYNGTSDTVNIYTYIHAEDGQTRIVKSSYTGDLGWPGVFFYYPDNRAYKMVLFYGSLRYELPLSVHPFLNGAYYLAWDEIDVGSTTGDTPPTVVDDAITEANKIYCSDASNPYVFPASGVYTIGTGHILGLASIATPLSTGQAGQFNLMVFCSDGNYAYNVAEDGSFSNSTDIQRDVCAVPASITTLDKSVLFLSSRGAMMTDESRLVCLSDMLDGVGDALPQPLDETWQIPASSLEDLLKSEYVAYDYPNQRILFFRESGNTFIYSITDKAWSSATFSAVRGVLNIYPASYVQLEASGNIIKLDSVYNYTDVTPRKGVVYTRPLKLDTYQLKKILQFALQGKGFSAVTRLYGSQDGEKWHLLGRTSALCRQHLVGRSFKYFRLAVECSMGTDDNFSGIRLGYEVSKESRFR